MAGFFQDIGEFFSGEKQNQAEQQQEQLAQQTAAAGKQYAGQLGKINKDVAALEQQNAARGAGYEQGARASMGQNAAEYMQNANRAAADQAGQAANAASLAAAKNMLKAARTGGLSRAEAARRAGTATGDIYGQTYQGQLDAGRGQYQNATQQFANQGQAYTGMQMQGQNQRAQNTQAAGNLRIGGNQSAAAQQGQLYGQGQQSAAGGGGAVSGILSAAGQLLSDKDQKTNIIDSLIKKASGEKPSPNGEKPSRIDELIKKAMIPPDVTEVAEKVRPVDFEYKEDPGKERKGVLAQDIEKTSMKENVKDTPMGKTIDVAQQTGSNTNLISQLAQMVIDLHGRLAAMEGK